MIMRYYVTNQTGARFQVSEGQYNDLKDKAEYKTEAVEPKPEKEYPYHKGAGHYELSNGDSVRGKENALEAQNEIDNG